MQVFNFGFFSHLWKKDDELFLIVSDTERLDVSTAHPNLLKNVMTRERFRSFVSPEERARKLIVPPEDKISKITELKYVGSVQIDEGVWRHFVFVVGRDFRFKDRLGREYITSTVNLVANLGQVNGPVVEKVITSYVPHLTILQ